MNRAMIEAIGESDAFLEFQDQLAAVARIDRPVLIVGERGTGKELASLKIHYLSGRWDRSLVTLNCATLAPTLLESELFGHEAGAFTGAAKRKPGRFERADQGDLFLDEIGLIPLSIQEKILRVIEYGEFERVGASEPIRVDVRIIGATNVDLPQLAEEGRFMKDLLDRLSFEVIHVPPLRVRGKDILLLAQNFASKMALELGRSTPYFSKSAERALLGYAWPGNIRELKNVVERSVYRTESDCIGDIHFDPFLSPFDEPQQAHEGISSESEPDVSLSLTEAVKALELERLRSALTANSFHQGKAAEALGLSYHQFRALYRKYKAEL